MIKVVSFDIGGTLLVDTIEFDSSKYTLNALAELLNLPYDAVRCEYKKVFQVKKGTFDELINEFCSRLNINPTNELRNFFKNKFSNKLSVISKNNIKLIREIKDRGYKVIFFSNSCCLNNNNINKEIMDIIDGLYYSYELGYTKNEEASYRYIEKELDCQPEEFIHIGDTLKSDYLKPIEYGWNALYYGKTNDNTIKSITSLDKVLEYLPR